MNLPAYVIRKTLPVMQFLVSQGNWTEQHYSATFFKLTDTAPLLTEMNTSNHRLSVGVAFDETTVVWLPTALGNWYVVDDGIPLAIVDALQVIKPNSTIRRLPEGRASVLVGGKAYPADSGFYLKTSEEEAKLAAALLGGEVSVCSMPY